MWCCPTAILINFCQQLPKQLPEPLRLVSRGGNQALYNGLSHLDKFSYLCCYSSFTSTDIPGVYDHADDTNSKIHLFDNQEGPVIGKVRISGTGSVEKYKTFKTSISNAMGVHDLYLCFSDTSGDTHLDWWQFK